MSKEEYTYYASEDKDRATVVNIEIVIPTARREDLQDAIDDITYQAGCYGTYRILCDQEIVEPFDKACEILEARYNASQRDEYVKI